VSFRPAVLSYDDLRRLAEEFLEEFHEERTLPVPIEEIVEFDFEIEVVPMEGILDDLEVDAFLTSDLNQIYVDAFVLKHRYRRFRFSLAHELAHHELHRPLYEGTRIRSVVLASLVRCAHVGGCAAARVKSRRPLLDPPC
jgi:hypothetical protein